jgi:hypothetical protein
VEAYAAVSISIHRKYPNRFSEGVSNCKVCTKKV